VSALDTESLFVRRLASWDRDLLSRELANGLSTLRQITSRPIQDLVAVSHTLASDDRDAMLSLVLRHHYSRVTRSFPDLHKDFALTDEEASALLKFRQECARQHASGDGQNYIARAYGFDRTGCDLRATRLDGAKREIAAKWCGDKVAYHINTTMVFIKKVGPWEVRTVIQTLRMMACKFTVRHNDTAEPWVFTEGTKPYLTYDFLAKYGTTSWSWQVAFDEYIPFAMDLYERQMQLFWEQLPALLDN